MAHHVARLLRMHTGHVTTTNGASYRTVGAAGYERQYAVPPFLLFPGGQAAQRHGVTTNAAITGQSPSAYVRESRCAITCVFRRPYR